MDIRPLRDGYRLRGGDSFDTAFFQEFLDELLIPALGSFRADEPFDGPHRASSWLLSTFTSCHVNPSYSIEQHLPFVSHPL